MVVELDIKTIRECCKNILALCSDYEDTEDKGKINDILIDLELNANALVKGVRE